MNNINAIEVHDLYKSYGKVEALRGVNIDVREGEIFGFLGPNGAGKTTTIRCLLDMIRPQSGSIRLLGIDPHAPLPNPRGLDVPVLPSVADGAKTGGWLTEISTLPLSPVFPLIMRLFNSKK